MKLAAGIYAAKTLLQHLCERYNDPANAHFYRFQRSDTIQTQILRSRGFAAYVPDALLQKRRGWLSYTLKNGRFVGGYSVNVFGHI
jgi:hypothetical protein